MTYSTLASFAQTGGLLLFVIGFSLAVAYALLPSNRATYEQAARLPLEED
jgi:cytochrome c oxidase cbb3-type subunit 4